MDYIIFWATVFCLVWALVYLFKQSRPKKIVPTNIEQYIKYQVSEEKPLIEETPKEEIPLGEPKILTVTKIKKTKQSLK